MKKKGLFIFLFLASRCFSQHYNLTVLNQANGIPGSRVYQVIQDGNGFMWFCTDNGLSCYDGREMSLFKEHKGYDLASFHVEKDSTGALWFITNEDKFFCGKGLETWSPPLPERLRNLRICWVSQEKDGLWFGTRTGIFGCFYKNHLYQLRLSISPVSNFSRVNKNYFIIYANNDIYLFNVLTKRVRRLGLINDRRIVTFPRFLKLASGSTLICTSKGIYLLNPEKLSVSCVFPTAHTPIQGEIFGLFEDKEKGIWIGTHRGAFCFEDGQIGTSSLRQYIRDELITCITQDHENNYWFGSFNGAYYLKNKRMVHYSNPKFPAPLQFIIPARKGKTYFLSSAGNFLELRHSQLTPCKGLRTGNFSPVFYHFMKDSSVFINSPQQNFQLKENTIHAVGDAGIIFSLNGHSWFYSFHRGIGYKTRDGKDTIIDPSFADVDPSLRFYLVDRHHNAWFGSKRGLYRFDGTRLRFLGSGNTLYGKSVTDIKQQKKGTLWVATTSDGIYSLGDPPEHYTDKNGLSSAHIKSIFIDEKDHLWISTPEGVDRIAMNEGKWPERTDHLDATSGLLTNEVNAVYGQHGVMYVASPEGLTIFRDKDSGWYLPPPEIFIRQLPVDAERIQDRQFTFSTISFSSGKKVSFRYQLMPIDQSWKTLSQNNIRFSNLAPGDYTLMVYGVNATGTQSLKPARYAFAVMPMFWQTGWFKWLVILTVLGAGYFLTTLRVKAVKRKENLKKKVMETELKALRSQMNPHFVFNSLNAIQDYILDHKPEEANFYLAKFASLMRKIIEYSKRTYVTVEEEIEFLDLYMELEQLRYPGQFKVFLNIDESIDREVIRIPSMLVQPVVENAVKYGVSGKREGGIIKIKAVLRGKNIIFEIEDNGPGREAVRLLRDNTAGAHQSTGLKNIMERLDVLTGESNHGMVIEDLYDADNRPCGTKVTLYLPIIE